VTRSCLGCSRRYSFTYCRPHYDVALIQLTAYFRLADFIIFGNREIVSASCPGNRCP
jgi:hypothetical protein